MKSLTGDKRRFTNALKGRKEISVRFRSRLSFILAVASIGGAALIWAQNPGGGAPAGGSAPATGGAPNGPGAAGPTTGSPGMGPMDTPMQARVDDKKFLKDATMGSMTEVQLGKLAAEKGSADTVKQYGQKLASDHTKATEELKQIAAKENIQVPDSLDSKHQSKVDKLAKLSGPQFDRAFVKDQMKDHEKDVSDYQAEAQYGTNPNVKMVAAKELPTLQQHLAEAKDLNKQKSAEK
jgi:putative membrane protein